MGIYNNMLSNFLSIKTRRWHRRWFYGLLSLVMALTVCVAPLPSQGISWFDLIRQGAQVIQLSNISDQQEVQLGKQINQQIVGSQFQLERNPEITGYVNQIGQRLAANSARPNIPYTFQVVKDNSINAFATMGGFVYVHSGLLKAADNEAQLASVLGHEIGHITARHAVHQMREQAIASGLATAVGLNSNKAVQIGVDLAIQRPTSREHEFEADQRGLRTLGRTGYPQSAMIAFMQKLLKAPSPPTFLSDHPATADRIVALKRSIDPAREHLSTGLDSAAYKAKIQPLLSRA